MRLVLRLSGETILGCTPVIGYLHRGIEKTLENRPVMGGIRYMDNVDYISPMLNEIAYAGAVEQLMEIEPPRRAQYIRLLVGELQRIASHLVATGAYINDLGSPTPLLWTFRDREGILALFEALGGSRFNKTAREVPSPFTGRDESAAARWPEILRLLYICAILPLQRGCARRYGTSPLACSFHKRCQRMRNIQNFRLVCWRTTRGDDL